MSGGSNAPTGAAHFVSPSLRYELADSLQELPVGYAYADAASVAVDSQDRVYVAPRGQARVLVYERDGLFVGTWGEGTLSSRTHCIRFAPDGTVYTVDDGDHAVRKFAADGALLMTLGTPGISSDTGFNPALASGYDRLSSIKRGGGPFNRPTGIAVGPDGSLYVSDGYGNARVHHFAADGQLLGSWGSPGGGPGELRLPHDVCTIPGRGVLVAERDNDRLQLFGFDGSYLTEWTDIRRPTGLCCRNGLIFVSELAWAAGQRSFRRGPIIEDEPGRLTVLGLDGSVVARWQTGKRRAPVARVSAPHAICVDSRGAVYVAEVNATYAASLGLTPPGGPAVQKFRRA